MSKPITAEDKPHVQQFIKDGQEERIFHNQDVEAMDVIAGKRDRERLAQEETQRRIHKKFETEQRRIQKREEDERIREEAALAEWEENRHGFRNAVIAAGILCGFGGLNLIDAWRPDFAVVAGGVLILAGIATIVIAAAAMYKPRPSTEALE